MRPEKPDTLEKKGRTYSRQEIEAELKPDPFALSSELKKELEDQGLAARFISVSDMQKNGGVHPFGWSPYKRKAGKEDSDSFLFGADPNGYIRRGDVILATKPQEKARAHRAYLDDIAEKSRARQSNMRNRQQFMREIQEQGLSKYLNVKEENY